MKIIVLFVIVASLLGLPVYMLESRVMPQLINMEQAYAGFDAKASDIATFADAE